MDHGDSKSQELEMLVSTGSTTSSLFQHDAATLGWYGPQD